MPTERLEGSRERDDALRLIRKKFGIGGLGWIEYRESYEAAFEAGRASLEQENADLLNHALQCMNRSCKRCNAAIKERYLG